MKRRKKRGESRPQKPSPRRWEHSGLTGKASNLHQPACNIVGSVPEYLRELNTCVWEGGGAVMAHPHSLYW